MTHDSDRGNIE